MGNRGYDDKSMIFIFSIMYINIGYWKVINTTRHLTDDQEEANRDISIFILNIGIIP